MRGELFVAGVGVVVVLRQQVDIVQEDAAPVFVSEGLAHPDVQQLGSVKSAVPPLKAEKRQRLTHSYCMWMYGSLSMRRHNV